MEASYERKTTRVSGGKINFIKNTVNSPCSMTGAHWHNVYEILYVRRGTGIQRINSSSFGYVPGSVTVICPGDVHTTVAESRDGCEIDVVQLAGEYFGPREELLVALGSVFVEATDERIASLFDKIRELSCGGEVSDVLLTAGAVFTLCGILAGYSRSTVSAAPKNAFTKAVCEHLRSADDLSLRRVAQIFGYSPEHFSRKFHAELGISYKHYCEKLKIQRLIRVLDDSSVSLEEIALLLGYSDTSSFVRAFKRIYGFTPGAYRKMKNQLD